METMERTKEFVDLLLADNAIKTDICAKYSIMADAYLGSAGKGLVDTYKDTFRILLSSNVIDFMTYMYMASALTNEIVSNPKLGIFLDPSKDVYVGRIASKLKANEWDIPKTATLDDITRAISLFGLESVDAPTNDDIVVDTTSDSDEPQYLFDDINADLAKAENLSNDEEDEDGDEDDDKDGGEPENYGDLSDLENNAASESGEATSSLPVPPATSVTPDDEDPTTELERKALNELESMHTTEVKAEVLANNTTGDVDVTDKLSEMIAEKDKLVENKLKEAEEQNKRKQVDDTIEKELANKEVDKVIVSKTVKNIMASYDVMYQPLFSSTPVGILTAAGIVTVKSDNALQVMGGGNAYAIKLYQTIMGTYNSKSELIRELDYHEEVSMDCINPNGTLRYNYIPNLHIRNIYGIYRGADGTLKREKNWVKFRSKLVSSLTKYVTDLLTKFKGDPLDLSQSLIELFTTVIIIEDFDIEKSLKLSMKSISVSKIYGDCGAVGRIINNGDAFPIDTNTIEVVNNSSEQLGIQRLLVVFDKAMYNGEILFAYKPIKKIIESGGKIGLKDTLLGRDLKGANVTYNFDSPQAVDTLVIAGSGSGKGVVTLNMLATFIASGCPTVYIDWKPDMAAMLWDLERETGARILSIDGLSGKTSDGCLPVRNYGTGINVPNIPGISEQLNVIPYIKSMQIMVLCASGRHSGYNGMTSKGKKMQFILDEAQAMNKKLSLLKSSMTEYIKENKPSKSSEPTEEYKYVIKLQKLINSLFPGCVEFRNTTGRTGNVGLIMLGQQSDCTAWADGALKRDSLGFLVGNCSMKLLGKDACDTNKYSLNGAQPVGSTFLGSMGYFALVPQAVADPKDKDKIKVIKTYLVLNKNDYNPDDPDNSGSFTSGIMKNVSNEQLKQQLIDEDFYPMNENGERYINPLVGFQGLIEYIGQNIPEFDLNKNLEAGYVEVEKLLSGLGIISSGDREGKYSCIEEYIFDCSSSGLFTLDELTMLMNHNDTIFDILDDDDYSTPDGEGGEAGFDGESTWAFAVEDSTPVNENSAGFGGQKSEFTGSDAFGAPATAETKQPQAVPRQVQEILNRQRELEQEQQMEQGHEPEPEPVEPMPVYSQSEQSDLGTPDTRQPVWEQQPDEKSSINDNGFTDRTYKDPSETPPVRGYDYTFTQPEYMPPDDHKTFDSGGITGRAIYVTPERTTKVLGLTKDNSVLVTMPTYSTAEKFHKTLFRGLWGAQYEFKNRWRAILNGVATNTNPNLVTRFVVMEDTVVFNKKQVATINIIGGEDDIRIEDLVNFKMTASKFKNIENIILDEITFERAQIEFGDPINGMFNAFKKLQWLTVFEVGCGATKLSTTRQEVLQGQVNEKAQKMTERTRFKSQIDVMAAAKNPRLNNSSVGYQNKVWEATKNFQGQGWGAAKTQLMKENPNFFKAAGISLVTIGVLGVGGILGGIGKIGSIIRR